jgi:hypothetical protein
MLGITRGGGLGGGNGGGDGGGEGGRIATGQEHMLAVRVESV